jgi:uncharacterized membrane protein required for colicin V production
MESTVIGQDKNKTGTLLVESARGAQRGLLLILGSALIWFLAIWAGYHFF